MVVESRRCAEGQEEHTAVDMLGGTTDSRTTCSGEAVNGERLEVDATLPVRAREEVCVHDV